MLKQNERFEKNPDLNQEIWKNEAPKKKKHLSSKNKVIVFTILFILCILCIIGIVFLGVNITTPIPR